MAWAQYRDTDHQVLEAFQIHAFPTYLVITGDRETLGSMRELEGVSPK